MTGHAALTCQHGRAQPCTCSALLHMRLTQLMMTPHAHSPACSVHLSTTTTLTQLLLAEHASDKVPLDVLVVKIVGEEHEHLGGAHGNVGVQQVRPGGRVRAGRGVGQGEQAGRWGPQAVPASERDGASLWSNAAQCAPDTAPALPQSTRWPQAPSCPLFPHLTLMWSLSPKKPASNLKLAPLALPASSSW